MVPRDGTISSISAFFSSTIAAALVGTALEIKAELYSALPADNVLSLIPGSTAVLTPALTGIISIGDSATITQPLNIPVTAGTRLALVMSITSTGVELISLVTGTVNAGLGIS